MFRTDELRVGAAVPAFADVPAPGDVLLVGLDTAAPGNAVALHFGCKIDGVGVDPLDPPLRWEAWNGSEWEECDVEHDETGGLNRAATSSCTSRPPTPRAARGEAGGLGAGAA